METTQIFADGASVNANPAAVFRGLGCVTGNGSSRLLMDYKALFPDAYDQIIRLLFQPGYGAGLSHIKIEFGADINSSSGTEPCTMRSADKSADVTRGAGFMLAADAKKVNPDLTVDLLRWGEPHWVTAAFEESKESGFAARYRWFRETLFAAYETYGLTFDFISPDANETDRADTEWLLYFAKHLKEEKGTPYDFSAIKLVASDEVGSRTIAAEMLANDALRDAIDVIGLHYTTYGDDNTQLLHDVYGKEIWYSEGIAPCNVPALSCRTDGCGMSGKNGPIDTANRIINSYCHGRMVMYEFQPAASAYYDGACYAPKQLLTANSPWSGQFRTDAGFWIASHFTRFCEKGWQYVDSACFGDGEENHAIWDTTHNYMTLVSPDRKHLTMHLSNDSNVPRSYLVVIRNLPELPRYFSLVETKGNHNPFRIDEHWFRVTERITTHSMGGEMAIPLVVAPHSLLTLTTMDTASVKTDAGRNPKTPAQRLTLPYRDQFGQNADFLKERGNAPMFTTDQGGAFEITATQDGSVLEQKILKDALPTNWRFRGTPEPLTCLGDDTWSNYRCKTIVQLASSDPENYAAIGARYNSAVTLPETSVCGFSLRLYGSGMWELRYMDEILADGMTPDFDPDAAHTLVLICISDQVLGFVDAHPAGDCRMTDRPHVRSGRAWLQSAYEANRFQQLSITPLPTPILPYCYRIDALSPWVRYAKNEDAAWALEGMAPYQFFNRTFAKGEKGAVMELRFYGTGISVLGVAEDLAYRIHMDGKVYAESHVVDKSLHREAIYSVDGLNEGWHTMRLTILKGSLSLDALEIPTSDTRIDYSPSRFPADPQRKKQIPDKREKRATDPKKLAIPLAGAAAAGLAVAFTVGHLVKKKKK
ncbi:MAG: hypothetical protein IJN11_09965 [Oscillospiraceae bacterium]|nr:hypothetical protein [Oscillospiraceae bacterium]